MHGGAWNIPIELRRQSQQGCEAAAATGAAVLAKGGPAIDAVEAAVRVLEDDPSFDAVRATTHSPPPRCTRIAAVAAAAAATAVEHGAPGVVTECSPPATLGAGHRQRAKRSRGGGDGRNSHGRQEPGHWGRGRNRYGAEPSQLSADGDGADGTLPASRSER